MSMHLRVAAGVCAVSTGLLIVGPATAIAAADTGSDGSSSTGAGSVHNPIGGLADSLGKAFHDTAQNAFQGVTGTLTTLAKSGSQASSAIKPPKMLFGGTPTVHGSTAADPAVPESGAADETGDAPVAGEKADPAIKTNGVAADTVQTNSLAPPAPTFPAASAPVIPPVPPVLDVVAPVSNVFNAVVGSVASTPALLAALPTSATPVSDVIGSLQAMLTSVVDASAPLAQLPADLTGLLTGATTTPGVTTGIRADGRSDGIGSSVGVAATEPNPTFTPTTVLPALPGFGRAPSPDLLGGPTLLNTKTAGAATGVTGSIAAAATPTAGASVLSVVERVIGVVVATVSITALLAVALPGILGLLGTCAAGVRIGYRQAKAGSELPDTAIARFVGSGPVGVVRSGSQISLRPRVVRQALGRARTSAGERPARASLQLLDRAV